MEKVRFVEIHSRDNERGCDESNRYFAEFFGMSERQLRRCLVPLKDIITLTMKSDTESLPGCVANTRLPPKANAGGVRSTLGSGATTGAGNWGRTFAGIDPRRRASGGANFASDTS